MTHGVVDFREEHSAKLPALTVLCALGYEYLPPARCTEMRGGTRQVILPQVLREVLAARRYSFQGQARHLSTAAIDKIVHELSHPPMHEGLRAANEKIYNALTYGVGVTEFVDGRKASPTVQIIDWENPANNHFHVTEELVVENARGTGTRRPDIVCFINGLPWVVIEAKRPDGSGDGKPTVDAGVSQSIRNQGVDEIPLLFAYSQLLLAINGHEGRYGTCGTPAKFWAAWQEEAITSAEFATLKNAMLPATTLDAIFGHRTTADRAGWEALLAGGERVVTDQDRLLVSLLRPDRLLDMARLYSLFDQRIGRIVARYQQVFGIRALVERITSFDDKGARNGGVIWHTTGSGKSFTMVFLAKALIWLKPLAQCRVVVVTDRVDLEDQLARTFAAGGALSERDRSDAMATTGKRLAQQIGSGNERIIFSIINKFGTAVLQPECRNDSADIIVLVDEGHRSQGGENSIRMRQALPRAAFVGFTGTPLLKDDKTQNKFGSIIHSYTMQQAVADRTVTPLLYEERVPGLSTNDAAIDAWFDRITDKLTDAQRQDLKKKYARKGEVYKVEGRLELIAHDISDHFQNFKVLGLRGQLACDSKASAILYKGYLDSIGKLKSVVAISSPDTREGNEKVDEGLSKDERLRKRKRVETQEQKALRIRNERLVRDWWADHVQGEGEETYTKRIIAEFGADEGPDLMIVVDKLLTGFDEPRNAVLYIDKPLKQHNLIQAIARVNRLHTQKQFGYLIDYRGILKELDVTIAKYQALAEQVLNGFDAEDLKGLYRQMSTEYKKLPGLYAALWAVFDGVANKQDGAALRQWLAPKIDTVAGQATDTNLKRRDDFYAALKVFGSCMKVALQSADYFDDKSFDATRQRYKNTLKMMYELRAQAREDAEETVDYSAYVDDIRALLDKHISGVQVRDPDGVYLVGSLGKGEKTDELSDDEARTRKDKISGRVTRVIEQDLADDPWAQAHFSELLKQAIEDARAMFDAPVKQYMLFADLEEKLDARDVDSLPMTRFAPLELAVRRHVQAYYGLFLKVLGNPPPLGEDQCFDYALEIDTIVRRAVAEFSINPQAIESSITTGLLPLLFGDIGVEKAQAIAQDVVQITRLGLSGST